MSVVALMFLSVNPCYCRHWIPKCMRCGVVRPFWRVTVTYYYYLDEFRAVDCVPLSLFLSMCRWRRRNWLRFVTWRIRFSMPWNFVKFYFRTTHETHKRHTLPQTWIFTRVQISMQIIRQIRIRHHCTWKGFAWSSYVSAQRPFAKLFCPNIDQQQHYHHLQQQRHHHHYIIYEFGFLWQRFYRRLRSRASGCSGVCVWCVCCSDSHKIK